jgi:hypothetical protein
MIRSTVVIGALALAGCASGGRGESAAGPTVNWEPGAYEIEARVPQTAGGRPSFAEHRAELIISADGTMRLTSNTGGLCQDPPPAETGADAQRGQRTFLCADSRYTVRPGAGTPSGEIFAEVEDERTVTQCVRYEIRNGVQVCAEEITRIVTERSVKRARLQVLRRPGS